jgi:hypothetical protein
MNFSAAITLEVVPNEAQRNEHNRSDVAGRVSLVPDALINCPPTTDRSNYTERDEGYQNLSVTVDNLVVHKTREKKNFSDCAK